MEQDGSLARTLKYGKNRGDPDPFIQSPIAASLEEADVSSLRIPDEPWWDDILNDLFNDRDKGLIKSVPLSARDERDRWMGAPG